MTTSIIIVDDFLDNAEEIRAAALTLDYPDVTQKTAYPGRNSRQKLYISGLDETVSRLVGEPVAAQRTRTSHANCRLTLKDESGSRNVHIDSSDWSGVLYLNRPGDCRGGTDFFRHKPTGTERAPLHRAELESLGYSGFRDVLDNILEPDSNNPEQWEHIMRIPMRFNRLVLLRPWHWHNAGPSFGTGVDDGRLIYLMFFDTPTPAWNPIGM